MKYIALLFFIVFINSACSDPDVKLSYTNSDSAMTCVDSIQIKNYNGMNSYEITGIELGEDTLITYSEMKSNVKK